MRYLFISLLLSVLIFSCEDEKTSVVEEDELQFEGIVREKIDKQAIKTYSKSTYSIGDSLKHINLSRFKYFGTFFKGRAHYFYNHQDSINNSSHKGHDLLLTFFDNQLARLKYQLESDISGDLLRKYGSCKIKPLDSIATTIVKSRKILIKEQDKMRLNEQLINYQMTWLEEGREIVFTSRERFGLTPSFTYEERIPDYKDAVVYLTRY